MTPTHTDESKATQSGNSSALVHQEMTDRGTAAPRAEDKASLLSPVMGSTPLGVSLVGRGQDLAMPVLGRCPVCESALQELAWKKQNFPHIKIKLTLHLESSSDLFSAG